MNVDCSKVYCFTVSYSKLFEKSETVRNYFTPPKIINCLNLSIPKPFRALNFLSCAIVKSESKELRIALTRGMQMNGMDFFDFKNKNSKLEMSNQLPPEFGTSRKFSFVFG